MNKKKKDILWMIFWFSLTGIISYHYFKKDDLQTLEGGNIESAMEHGEYSR